MPGVTGKVCPVNDEHAQSAFARCLFVLVSPSTVVGHGLAFEEAVVSGRRLVDNHQQYFAFHVHAGVVVPVILGGIDAVANEDDRRVDISRRCSGLILGYEVFAVSERNRLTILRHELGFGLVFNSMHGIERHFLKIGPVVACGFYAVQSKLCSNVFSGNLRAALAWTASFEEITCKKAYMRAYFFGIDAVSGLARSFRHSGNCRDLCLANK